MEWNEAKAAIAGAAGGGVAFVFREAAGLPTMWERMTALQNLELLGITVVAGIALGVLMYASRNLTRNEPTKIERIIRTKSPNPKDKLV